MGIEPVRVKSCAEELAEWIAQSAKDHATIAALHKRVEELERALEPFAKAGGTPMFGDEEQVPLSFKGKHFRRARNALSANCHGADSPQNGADSAALRAKGGGNGDA